MFLEGHLSLLSAKLGFLIVHSKKGDAASRGKIERFFRTVRDSFIPFFHINHSNTSKTLELLNTDFHEWLDKNYNNKVHSVIKATPCNRYYHDMQTIKLRKPSPQELHNAFMHVIHRRVNNDSTVPVWNQAYEVPYKYISKKVEIRYPIDAPEMLYLFEDDKQVMKLQIVNKNRNADFPIRFRDIIDDENTDQEA